MSISDQCLKKLKVSSNKDIHYYSLPALSEALGTDFSKFPYAVKVFLEMMVRMQPHPAYEDAHIIGMANWTPAKQTPKEFPYMPSRVLLQDFTGVPCVVDLAAMRSALKRLGKDPSVIEPQVPVDLVIDHSVQIDEYRGAESYDFNIKREFERNTERYVFLRWGQQAFEKLQVLPPGLGICHQVNMEFLGHGVSTVEDAQGRTLAIPDTCVGTDSHTPMINSMGVVGWGVGGIEAEAAMLGQPMPMLTPDVVGCRLVGKLAVGCTPTDLALRVTEILREKGVVGRFVEYFGSGLDAMNIADRAPLSNMTPEYGATMGIFPIDAATLDYLRQTGRSDEQVELVEAYCRAQGMFRDADSPEATYSECVEIDLSDLVPSVAGPMRPQDRVPVSTLKHAFESAMPLPAKERGFNVDPSQNDATGSAGEYGELKHGSLVIAAITSCTNTSNPTLMVGAGMLAKRAIEAGLSVPPYVKTSFAPGSRVVTEYLTKAGLIPYLEQLGFYIVAYGCTTCIGNSGPLLPEITSAITDNDLVVSSVLSGNRNFEGRIHPLTKANFLASPLLVVAYALAGRVDIDLTTEPVGKSESGEDVFLKDIWPSSEDISALLAKSSRPEDYAKAYSDVMNSSPEWSALPDVEGAAYAFDANSSYIQEPPFFADFTEALPSISDIKDASALALLGDFITTDHISPAGAIPANGPAGKYLLAQDIPARDFNSFGSRRGSHEVMMRGTFANIRMRNLLVDTEGGTTLYHPTGEEMSIFDASERYRSNDIPLVVLAGKMYGAGSSRDWAAKGAQLLGVKAVIAENYERIHRSNLAGMGVLPLEFLDGDSHTGLGLTGKESFSITGIESDLKPGKLMDVVATRANGETLAFQVKCRLDSTIEVEYYRNGGILQYVLRGYCSNDKS